jgi:hypothetical protein
MFQRASVQWSLALAIAFLTAPVAASGPPPFFPAHCRVVLLAGLAGDLDNEILFREQLQTWCDLVGRSGRVESLYVLCDDPQSVILPKGSQGERLSAGRDTFIELGHKLRGGTNPLVVIAWGHGGKQGTTPVFHVRGPRLTPADFTDFANQAGGPCSNWLLLFRGSGAFAKQLASSGRQVLSSDCGEQFGSDPVTMGLLLKVVRGHGADSFQDVGAELGRATQDRYKERHLALAEQPAFWNGTKTPILLCQAVRDVPPATRIADEAQDPPANHAQILEKEEAGQQQALSPAWRELPRVAPGDYPEANAVVLRQRLACRVGQNPALVTEQEEFIQILTPRGKVYGDFDVSYWPPGEELEFLECEVLKTNGQLARLDADMIGEAGPPPGDYEGPRRKRFSLPGIAPGAIVHVRYSSQWRTFPLPQVSMELPLGGELPVLNCTLTVSVPREAPFHFAFDQMATADPCVEQMGYGTTYGWQFTNQPASCREVLENPHHSPRLAFSTFADWQSFAGWFNRISRMSDQVTPEISAKALELTRDAQTERDKVIALYNYVAGLRYIAVPLGINSFRPHAAANVLRNQFGDCKDKANLFNALLHALKLDAQLVLVPRYAQAHDAVPGLAFNHAISLVTLGSETLWADTTEDICRFGFLPPGDPGRKVLVLDGHSTQLTQLPLPDARQQRLRLRGVLDCTGATDALPLRLRAVAQGYPDYELRAAAHQSRGAGASLPLLAVNYRPASGAFSLQQQTSTPVDALNEDFTWDAQGASVGLCAGAKEQRRLRAPFWLPREWDLALHQRRSALFLNKGYPLTLEEEFEIAVPPRATTPVLPAVCTDIQGPLRWHIEWASVNHEKLVARFHAELAQGELSAAETTRLQEQLRALLAALASEASFSVPDQIAGH